MTCKHSNPGHAACIQCAQEARLKKRLTDFCSRLRVTDPDRLKTELLRVADACRVPAMDVQVAADLGEDGRLTVGVAIHWEGPSE